MIHIVKNLFRPIWRHTIDTYLRPQIDRLVEAKLQHLVKYQSADQLFYDVANFVVYNQVQGDYLEFGVYEGNSLAKMYQYLLFFSQTFKNHAALFNHEHNASYWQGIRFIAFDSFAGLPASQNEDTPAHFAKAGIYSMPLDRFMANIEEKGVDTSKVITIPGYFDETLTNDLAKTHAIQKAGIIFIDCDLYESAIPIFRFITDLIQDGTIIIVDDFFRYKGHPHKGIRRAFSEWLEKSPHIAVSELTRCSANRVAFVCHLPR
jgi:O-methyltransferase